MGNYTTAEIEEFRAKDIRISKQGLVQALITSRAFTKDEIIDGSLLFSTAEKYKQWVDGSLANADGKKIKDPDYWIVDWFEIVTDNDLPDITPAQEDIVEKIWKEYQDVCPEKELDNLKPVNLLRQLIKLHGKYPSKESSIQIVLGELPIKDLLT